MGKILPLPSMSVILDFHSHPRKQEENKCRLQKRTVARDFTLFPVSPHIFSPTDCAVKYKPAATHSSESLPGMSSFILDLSRECKEAMVSQNLFTPEFLQVLGLDIMIYKTQNRKKKCMCVCLRENKIFGGN